MSSLSASAKSENLFKVNVSQDGYNSFFMVGDLKKISDLVAETNAYYPELNLADHTLYYYDQNHHKTQIVNSSDFETFLQTHFDQNIYVSWGNGNELENASSTQSIPENNIVSSDNCASVDSWIDLGLDASPVSSPKSDDVPNIESILNLISSCTQTESRTNQHSLATADSMPRLISPPSLVSVPSSENVPNLISSSVMESCSPQHNTYSLYSMPNLSSELELISLEPTPSLETVTRSQISAEAGWTSMESSTSQDYDWTTEDASFDSSMGSVPSSCSDISTSSVHFSILASPTENIVKFFVVLYFSSLIVLIFFTVVVTIFEVRHQESCSETPENRYAMPDYQSIIREFCHSHSSSQTCQSMIVDFLSSFLPEKI